MSKRERIFLCAVFMVILAGIALRWNIQKTESDIAQHISQLRHSANNHPVTSRFDERQQLPPPVQRYFQFVFQGRIPSYRVATMQMSGQFRRPQQSSFNPTTAEQTSAIRQPGLVFSATTPIIPLVWARAYDAYVDGKMEMKAKILSTFTVVNEQSNPTLDQISLRRWLLESALYPMVLLPSEYVRWEAIDDQHARVIAQYQGVSTRMIATFAPSGELTRMNAEENGDLNTPYHGSGEQVERSDYQDIQGMMIPMQFSIARVHDGQVLPFWSGKIEKITFE